MSKISLEYDQEYFESQILAYQDASVNQNYDLANDIYIKICNIYHPERFISVWYRQYKYLYDSSEDFEQDYMRIFIQSLKKWKPREERSESRYNGTGTFKNYFWGSLSHNYINMVKSAQGAAKRNLTTRCPECGDWVNPISTHIIKVHSELLWEKLRKDGIDIDNLISCPFCKNSIYKGKSNTPDINIVKKHILSKHVYMLFDIFADKYPSVHSGSTKIVSTDAVNDASDESFTVYDITPAPSSLIDKIISSNLTPVQQLIVENVISKKTCSVKWSKSVYKCTQDEFDEALEGLKDKITLMEDSIGKY